MLKAALSPALFTIEHLPLNIQHFGFQPRLTLYKDLLLTWTQKVNLIGPEARENIDEHIEEAVKAAEILKPGGEVMDFGSGGGLPAIPMAIVSPDARFHLVEADQKKWAFLKHVARECSLNAVIYGDRLARVLERFPPDLRFSLVTSRAVGKPEEWVPSLRRHLADGARVALFQSSPELPEIDGFSAGESIRLPRGTANWLATLVFHVEQT
jgi:16S rRNA (guanine527-N7)-methyltransferase